MVSITISQLKLFHKLQLPFEIGTVVILILRMRSWDLDSQCHWTNKWQTQDLSRDNLILGLNILTISTFYKDSTNFLTQVLIIQSDICGELPVRSWSHDLMIFWPEYCLGQFKMKWNSCRSLLMSLRCTLLKLILTFPSVFEWLWNKMKAGRLKFNPGKMEALGETEEYFCYTELKSSQSRSDLRWYLQIEKFCIIFA